MYCHSILTEPTPSYTLYLFNLWVLCSMQPVYVKTVEKSTDPFCWTNTYILTYLCTGYLPEAYIHYCTHLFACHHKHLSSARCISWEKSESSSRHLIFEPLDDKSFFGYSNEENLHHSKTLTDLEMHNYF